MDARDPESRLICGVLVLATVPVVVATLLAGAPFGGGATLALVLTMLGLRGLLPSPRRCSGIPCARARSSSPRRRR
jgi:hypothetical protein